MSIPHRPPTGISDLRSQISNHQPPTTDHQRRTASVAATALAVLLLFPTFCMADDGSKVTLGQLELPSFPSSVKLPALDALASITAQRTSLKTQARSRSVPVKSSELYNFPLLFLPCNENLEPVPLDEEALLAQWLKLGGTLVVDWQGGGTGLESFRASVERFASSLLPGSHLERIPINSVVYRSFYRLNYASGRILVDDLYGVLVDDRYAIIVCFNDVLSAAEQDRTGNFRYDVIPGGTAQRENAYRLVVNLVVYALCVNYKDDKVHLDYLRSKRNWRLPGEE